MKLIIENCNNIDYGELKVAEKKLNIKYALNGTGKSTVAKAIDYHINNKKQNILDLQPFKHKGNKDKTPKITGLDNISKVMIFDEKYINQYAFQQDELVKNSFEIFIKDDKYIEHQTKIEDLISEVKQLFSQNSEIDELNKVLQSFLDAFKATNSGWSAAGILGKGLANGNKLENIPPDLEVYRPYLKHEKNVKWLQWQVTGNDYLDIDNCCPFCTAEGIDNKKDIITKIKQEYPQKYVEHLNSMVILLEKLELYLSPEANIQIDKIKKNVSGMSEEQKSYLISIQRDILTLNNRLAGMTQLGFAVFKNVDDIVKSLENLKIQISFIPTLNSSVVTEKIQIINSSIDTLSKKAGQLKGEITQQKILIAKKIEQHKTEINDFLQYAGYTYNVEVKEEKEEYKLQLFHKDFQNSISNASDSLSFGERNAFALILFMYDVLKQKPELIILDDPISSFDGNKKFAILNKLFLGSNNFNNETVLLLSHDFSIVIDTVYNLSDRFQSKAFFLENRDNQLIEKVIKKENINSYKQIAVKNVSKNGSLNELIYLRRLFEFEGEKNMGYQLLANLFHKRLKPAIKNKLNDVENWSFLPDDEINLGENEIKKYAPNFTYSEYISKIRNTSAVVNSYYECKNGYEKLQLFRVINLENPIKDVFEDKQIHKLDTVLAKYINETFHIENDYLFQLNPSEYEIIPQYVINLCDKYIENLKQTL